MKPNLFVIGAAKCGTTSLHEYLGMHPEIVMSTEKEPQFFLDSKHHEPYLHPEEGSDDTVLSMYLRLFPGMETKRYAGESSPTYTWSPHHLGTARKIFEFNADARLIYIVRDPIERTISHFWYWCAVGAETCTSPLLAIRGNLLYRDVSNYALQFKGYLQYFSREQIYVTTLEELMDEPAATMGGIFRWLGLALPAAHSNGLYSARKNVTPTNFSQRRVLFPWHLRKSRFFAHVRFLFPQILRKSAWALVTSSQLNSRKIDRSKFDSTDLIATLREAQMPEACEFEELCGRRFPQWRTLWGETMHAQAGAPEL